MLSLRTSRAISTLPIRVAELAAARNIAGPISLRDLLTSAGTRTQQPRICVLRYQWEIPKKPRARRPGRGPIQKGLGGPRFADMWPDEFFEQVFRAHNGWSLHDYWYRNTAGLVDIDFHIEPWAVLVGKDQSTAAANDRGSVVQMCKDQAAADGVALGGFDHVITFMYPGDNPAGASGRDAVLDQSPFSLEFYQHELGHVLGYHHSFGTNDDYVYEDPWCVMGRSRVQEHSISIPAELAGVDVDDPATFWRQGRRLSAAALFRDYDANSGYSSTSSVVNLDLAAGSQTVELVAVSESRLHDQSLAVAIGENFRTTIEYRTPSGDDRGIRPGEDVRSAVVVHSIGRRPALRWQGDKDPVWLESVIPAEAKADAWVTRGWESDPMDIHVEVMSAGGRTVTVRVSRTKLP